MDLVMKELRAIPPIVREPILKRGLENEKRSTPST